jgi:hypothetical protein
MRRPFELTFGLLAVSLAFIAAVTFHEPQLRRITHGGVALVLLLFPAGSSGQTSSLVLTTMKPAAQSSVSHNASASRAVDGNTNSQFSAASCTHTNAAGESRPWCTVDLGDTYAIEKVRFRSEPRSPIKHKAHYGRWSHIIARIAAARRASATPYARKLVASLLLLMCTHSRRFFCKMSEWKISCAAQLAWQLLSTPSAARKRSGSTSMCS